MINGQAAEVMITEVMLEMGFGIRCPFDTEKMLKLVTNNLNSHYDNALYHINYDFGFLDIAPGRFADRCLGCDGFVETEDGDLVSYDVSVNTSNYAINHKYDVKAATNKVRTLLGLKHHMIVFLTGDVPCKNDLTEDQKWLIVDSVLEGIENKKSEIYIKF